MEVVRSNKVMREEMLVTIDLMEQKCQNKEKEMRQQEERFQSFKLEYTKVLDERDYMDE